MVTPRMRVRHAMASFTSTAGPSFAATISRTVTAAPYSSSPLHNDPG